MDGGVLFGPMDIISGTASRAKLSPIRTDLKIIKGEPTDNGSPTYKIYDPIKNKYFNIGWKEFEIISRWGLGSAMRISSAINSDTTLAVSVEDVVITSYSIHYTKLYENSQAKLVYALC